MRTAHGSKAPEGDPSGDPDVLFLEKIVAILHQTRLKKKMTLRELAAEIGYSDAHLSKAERNLSQPGVVLLSKWCRALDLQLPEVMVDASSQRKS